MEEKLKQNIEDFELGRISKAELLNRLTYLLKNNSKEVHNIFQEIILSKSEDELELGLTLLFLIEQNNEFTDILNYLILEPWHSKYEDIIHILQERKDPSSVSFIVKAMQKKYDYLESYGTGTGQFVCQCGHALASIGTKAALDAIRDLSNHSENILIRVEMKYRLRRVLGDNFLQSENSIRWWDL
ncbi:hypothetical protein [Myroides sp. N17-2]|uniref:hypothetical protein n=1 Tax=Myroides sp. N17-2 TaxID=2030799 RepID=UPI000EFBF57A|nr:hypothetical protein [Myroides sp. N17-2]